MSDFLSLLKDAESLAREWRDFSRHAYGWECRTYGDDQTWCYFADNSDHTSVRLGKSGSQISVAFHSSVEFRDITHRSAAELATILQESRELLELARSEAARRSNAEVDAEKAARVEKLRSQLAELEGGIAA